MKVKKVGEIAQKTCETCTHYIPLDDKSGVCVKHIKYTYITQTCSYHTTEVTDELKLERIAEAYIEINNKIQQLQELKEILRKAIIHEVQTKAVTPKYIITVSNIKQKRLNTEKVKQFLKSINKLDEFLTESEYQRVKIKPIF